MIIVRNIFHIRQGGIRQAVEGMKQATANVPNRPHILTDLSGPMNTIVVERRFESMAAAEQWRNEFFQSPDFKQGEDPMNEWLLSGSTEMYTIEQE